MRVFGKLPAGHVVTQDGAGQQPGRAGATSGARFAALRGEIRHAGRRLAQQPSFWIPAVAALAVGIAAATAVFAMLYAVLLRPLPYPAADRLVRLRSAVPATGGAAWGLAKGEFLYFQQMSRSFESLGLYSLWSATAQSAGGSCRGAEEVLTAQASAGLTRALGISLTAGRPPLPDDGLPLNPAVAWLTQGYWARCYGRDPAIVGQTILLDGRPAVIAGVLADSARLPEQARRPELRVDLWVPLHLDPAEPPVASHVFRAIGRLRPGVSLAAAAAELSRLTGRLPEALPAAYSPAFLQKTGFTTQVVPLRDDVVGDVGRLLWLLFAATGLVLAVAAADVASLTMARVNARRNETTVRAALGATRPRLLLYFLSEPLLVAGAAGTAGLLLAGGALRLLVAYAPGSLPRLQEVRLGGAAVGFAAALSLGAGAVLGALPFGFRARTKCVLNPEGRHCTLSRRQRRAQHGLVVGQVALSLLLVAAAFLLWRTFLNLVAVPPGFEPAGVLTLRVVLPKERYASFQAVETFYRELARRLQALPGAAAVGSIDSLPLTGYDGCSAIYPDTKTGGAGDQAPCVPTYLVSPGYFQAMEIPLRGTAPSWSDVERRTPLAVVSKALARRLWPGADPLGRTVQGRPGATPYRIAAVADDVRAEGLDRPPVQALYLPFVPAVGAELWSPVRQLSLAVRLGADSPPMGFGAAVRRTVAAIDPGAAVADLDTMDQIVGVSLARVTLLAALMATAAAVTLLLALIGMYGLLTYLVGRQEPEIGIRMCLGARSADLRWQVLRESLQPALWGIAVGVPVFLAGSRYLRSYLYGVSATDWLTVGMAALVLLLLAGLAGWLPARRAARVSPLGALRQD